ncbi:MAG: FHA domain-containing protein [Chloroflexi bacterium]|nr:FHA domain-containing protein [Chloroflexota bacterium]
MQRKNWWKIFILCLIGFQLSLVGKATSQSDLQIRLSDPDLSAFPTLSFTIQTADTSSVPLTSLDNLTITENGISIQEFSQQSVPIGIDVVFVIDGNESILVEDGENGRSRLAEVKESISRYANRFMNPSGLDRVTIIVPDESEPTNGRILLNAANAPNDVITALNSYTPTPDTTTPLNRMMVSALTQARGLQTANRFQAILIYSATADRWQKQVNIDRLMTQAQAQQVAIFGAILGAGATVEEINNMTALTESTRGSFERMPTADGSDPIFLVWQRQANQTEIQYESQLTQSGQFPIQVTINGVSAETAVSLQLTPPSIQLLPGTDAIRREATGIDIPLADFSPASHPLQFVIQWLDNVPRDVQDVTLLVNGVPQFLPEPAIIDENGTGQFTWDIRNNDTGAYELVVQVTDSFGLTGESDSQLLTIIVEQQPLPTPTPLPATAVPPPPSSTLSLPDIPRQNALFGLAAGALGLIIVLFLRWLRRNRSILEKPIPRSKQQTAVPPPVPPPTEEIPPIAELIPMVEGKRVDVTPSSQLIIGHDADAVDLHLAGKGIAPRHAQLRYRNGRYWLTDEGSPSGTFLNHTRLGLGPQPLQDGDLIQIGRFSYQFLIKTNDEPS